MIPIPKGYTFSTAKANFRYKNRDDLGLILSEKPAVVAAVFTTNKFKAAPIYVCQKKLKQNSYKAQGIVINSGIANAGTGEMGIYNCSKAMELVGDRLKIDPNFLLPASTGVIGEQFKMECWEAGAEELYKNLGKKDIIDVAKAIMTTDTFPKISYSKHRDFSVTLVAKGAGMICPNMATMLCFIITDVSIERPLFQDILTEVTENTFNRISVDGDTSTNDCVIAMANGLSGKRVSDKKDILLFKQILFETMYDASYKIVQDAEGGTKVVHIKVKGTRTYDDAKKIAQTIANSPLVKTAFYGEDANWGRIVAAIGRSGVDVDISKVLIKIGDIEIFKNQMGIDGDIDAILMPYLKKQDIFLYIDIGNNTEYEYNMLFSDLTEQYVKINSGYRS